MVIGAILNGTAFEMDFDHFSDDDSFVEAALEDKECEFYDSQEFGDNNCTTAKR